MSTLTSVTLVSCLPSKFMRPPCCYRLQEIKNYGAGTSPNDIRLCKP